MTPQSEPSCHMPHVTHLDSAASFSLPRINAAESSSCWLSSSHGSHRRKCARFASTTENSSFAWCSCSTCRARDELISRSSMGTLSHSSSLAKAFSVSRQHLLALVGRQFIYNGDRSEEHT